LITFEFTTAIAGELLIIVDDGFIGIPFDKHFLSNS
jgi:hypothetical protein